MAPAPGPVLPAVVQPAVMPAISKPNVAGATSAPAAPAASVPAAFAPFFFQQKGANRTIKIGCAVPFTGEKQLTTAAIVAGLRMAIVDKAPSLLPGTNVNLTCLDSKCLDIPAYMALTRFADEKTGAHAI